MKTVRNSNNGRGLHPSLDSQYEGNTTQNQFSHYNSGACMPVYNTPWPHTERSALILKTLHHYIVDHFPVHVSQPEIPAGVAIRQPGMIHAQQVQHGGVEVVNRDAILHRLEPEFVGGP